jgi:chromosome segregation ATPase
MKSNKRKVQLLFISAVTLGLFLVGGCATNGNLSSQNITQGERAITEARQSNASLSAPVEMKTAEDKIAAARSALAKKEYEEATRLAEEAQADAEYARAKADSEKAKKTADEMRQNIQTLRQEIERLSKQ